MKSYDLDDDDKLHRTRSEKCGKMSIRTLFLLSSLATAAIVTFSIICPQNSTKLKTFPNQTHSITNQTHSITKLSPKYNLSCDLFEGHWIPDLNGSVYTNSSCVTIPDSKNCFKHGRKDRDFLNWRWKPNGCELPRFHANNFLEVVRGKNMAFIGDSVARNHMESLLCLLSQVETPKNMYMDADDRFRIWYFRSHDFTLTTLWTRFLVKGLEKKLNGTTVFDLNLDQIDTQWARHLPTIDYAIISAGHWLFREIYIYKCGNVIGCIYCNQPNITNINPSDGLRHIFRAALEEINKCKGCKGMVTVLRTFSPAHFENGTWNSGGNCKRVSPYVDGETDVNGFEWEFRNVEKEEIKRARKNGNGKSFRVLDVTRVMLMRPDGHPGEFWDNQWMRGFNDCVHWCLPGPIDVWNDFLMVVLGIESKLVS